MVRTRPSRRRAALLATTATVAVAWLGAAPASAHVSPTPSSVPAGGYADVQLGVGHGCDGSPTTKVEVQVPAAITSATPWRVPGWKVEVATEKLDPPVDDGHGGKLTDRDATITWTAEDGQALPDHQKMTFGVSFQAPAKEGQTLYFKTIQTCESGSTDWIDELDGSGDEPEHPAPAVKVTAASDEGDHHGSTTDTTEADDHGTESAATTSKDDDSDGASKGLTVAALAIAIAGLGVGSAALAKSRKA